MKHAGKALLIIFFVPILLAIGATFSRCTEPKEKTNKEKMEFMADTIQLTSLDLNEENFYLACGRLGITHPNIVYAQAVLESGHFTSSLYKRTNNMLGLYNSRKKCYYKFKHWSECLVAYRDMVQYKYVGGDYYTFLNDLPYAEDRHYVRKVRRLTKQRT